MNNQTKVDQRTIAIINACRENAAGLIKAAKAALKLKINNAAYHLSLLALEEIGKGNIVAANGVKALSQDNPDRDQWLKDKSEDHFFKLFWAFWTSAGAGKMTIQGFNDAQKIAREAHDLRKSSLYVSVSPNEVLLEPISTERVKNVIAYANIKLKHENLRDYSSLSPEGVDDFNWFMEAIKDSTKKSFIFSKLSTQKIAEFNDSKKWIAWLKNELSKQEVELKEMLEKEINRKKPRGKEKLKKKWKIRTRLQTSGVQLKQPSINWWNENVPNAVITITDKKKNELIIDFDLPKIISIEALYPAADEEARRLVMAFNIGTMGVFWWYKMFDRASLIEDIKDLDSKGSLIAIPKNQYLSLDWGGRSRKIEQEDIERVARTYVCLMHINTKPEYAKPFQYYFTALTFFCKNDLLLPTIINAGELFFFASLELMLLLRDIKNRGCPR